MKTEISNTINTTNNKKLDSYSILISSKYFKTSQDYINLMCVCKKFKETTEKLRFNPISVTSKKLFPKIQTQYLYNSCDKLLKDVERFELWCDLDYEDYLNFKENEILCHHINYTHENKDFYGDSIPKEVTKLYDYCYSDSDILTLTIPNTITYIGNNCFDSCTNLSNIELSSGLTKLNTRCFNFCYSLLSINIPPSIQTIENSCFYYCTSLENISIPKSVTSIERSSFYYCRSLKSITLPSSISELNSNTFGISKQSLYQILFKNLVNNAFWECLSLQSVDGVSELVVGSQCFKSCPQLKNKPKMTNINCTIY
ncbi:Leucine rich repeat containing protein BspA family protein [Entamoeba marina]